MYTLQQNRITFKRMFRLVGLLAGIWLLNSLLSPLMAQDFRQIDERADRKSACYVQKNVLNVALTVNETSPVTIRLFSIVGDEAESCCRDKIITPGTYSYTYTLSHLKPGIYFCAVEVGSSQYVHKLCVP